MHYDWHWFWNYGNGDYGNQGPHQVDIARWFLGEDAIAPFSHGRRRAPGLQGLRRDAQHADRLSRLQDADDL